MMIQTVNGNYVNSLQVEMIYVDDRSTDDRVLVDCLFVSGRRCRLREFSVDEYDQPRRDALVWMTQLASMLR